MSVIRKKLLKFREEVSKEVMKLENYVSSRKESWHETVTADKYEVKIDALRELLESLDISESEIV